MMYFLSLTAACSILIALSDVNTVDVVMILIYQFPERKFMPFKQPVDFRDEDCVRFYQPATFHFPSALQVLVPPILYSRVYCYSQLIWQLLFLWQHFRIILQIQAGMLP